MKPRASMSAKAAPEVRKRLIELWLYKFWVFEGPTTLGAQELQACSDCFAPTSLRSLGSRSPPGAGETAYSLQPGLQDARALRVSLNSGSVRLGARSRSQEMVGGNPPLAFLLGPTTSSCRALFWEDFGCPAGPALPFRHYVGLPYLGIVVVGIELSGRGSGENRGAEKNRNRRCGKERSARETKVSIVASSPV